MTTLFICTRDGDLVRVQHGDGQAVAAPALRGVGAQCVAADGPRVLVGTTERGVLLSGDAGDTWHEVRLTEPGVFSVAISAADGALYAGTEPSRLFTSLDGQRWTELDALQQIPSRDQWRFPPRPWTHHVRAIAPDPRCPSRILVGIELGGLMYTDDGGLSISDRRPGAKLDTHSLIWHPQADGVAYQAAGDGAAQSRDGGLTWHAVDGGRDLGYCWALAADPTDIDCWYVSAATGPRAAHSGAHALGRLYRHQAGTWRELSLPTDTMPYALIVAGSDLLAGMADGDVLVSGDRGETWSDLGARTAPILAMASCPDQ